MQRDVRSWHPADNPTAPAFVRYWTKADIAGFWPGTVCPLLTQSGHSAYRLCDVSHSSPHRKVIGYEPRIRRGPLRRAHAAA